MTADPETYDFMDLEEWGNSLEEIALRMAITFHLRIREQTPGPIPHPDDITDTARTFYGFLRSPQASREEHPR
jgi:hypothetical protein